MTGFKYSHLALNCRNPVATEEFYCKYFGFERARVYDPGEHQVVMIRLGECYLELFPAHGDSPLDPPEKDGYEFSGLRHFCLLVDNLQDTLNQLTGVVDISLGPLDMSQYIEGMRVAWVKDPDGNILELNQGYRDEVNPPEFEAELTVD